MEISVTMHIDSVGTNSRLATLTNDELKNLVFICQLGGIIIDPKSIGHIQNALWGDRKGGRFCDLAWDAEFMDALDWHVQMSDG